MNKKILDKIIFLLLKCSCILIEINIEFKKK